MIRLFACLRPLVVFTALTVAVLLVPAARADTVTWTLVDVTLQTGQAIVGTFDYNGSSDPRVSAQDITIDPLSSDPLQFTVATSTVFWQHISGFDLWYVEFWRAPLTPQAGDRAWDLVLGLSGVEDPFATVGTRSLTTSSLGVYDYVGGDWVPAGPQFVTGALSSVPLPPSAFLLGSGLIPLAWFRRRKRREK